MNLRAIIEESWRAYGLGVFDAGKLANTICHDGGYDFEGVGIDADHVIQFLNHEEMCPPQGMSFALPEVLSFYIANDDLAPEQKVAALLALLGTARLCGTGNADWGLQLDKILKALAQLSTDMSVSIKFAALGYVMNQANASTARPEPPK